MVTHTSVKFATTPTNRGCPTCRALHELQDNSISQQVVRQARQIIPKKAEAHVAMEIIGCEKQAAKNLLMLGLDLGLFGLFGLFQLGALGAEPNRSRMP